MKPGTIKVGRYVTIWEIGPEGIKGSISGKAPGELAVEGLNLSNLTKTRRTPNDTQPAFLREDGLLQGDFGGMAPGDVIAIRVREGERIGKFVFMRVPGTDETNAQVNLGRIFPEKSEEGFRLLSTTSRPIGEPGAELRFIHPETKAFVQITLGELGELPANTLLPWPEVQAVDVAVSDKVNNVDFNEITGILSLNQRNLFGEIDLPDPEPAVANQFLDGSSMLDTTRFRSQGAFSGPLSQAPIQGDLTNCHMPAGASAVAAVSEEAILEAFQGCLVKTEKGLELKPDEKGIYTFRFFEEGDVQKPVIIKVDGDLFTYDGTELAYGKGPVHGSESEAVNLLYPLLEKAYARWKGGYEVLAQGGSPAIFMAELMGGQPEELFLARRKPENIRKFIETQLQNGRPVALGTHGLDKIQRFMNSGITPEHSYSVLGVSEDGTKLKVRNPWGFGEPAGDGVDDGIFEFPIDTLTQYFDVLYTC